jgi:protein O-GlcNAc transferase
MTNEELLQSAAEHHDAGRLAEAEGLYRQVLEVEPGDVDALHYLGLLYLQMGRTGEALELIEKAGALRPDEAGIEAARAWVLTALGREDDAIGAWLKALVLNAGDGVGQSALGTLLWRRGRKEEAITAFRSAVAAAPEDGAAWGNLGSLLLDGNRLEEAEAACRRAVEVAADRAEAWNRLGIVLRRRGRNEQAVDAYRRAVGIRADYAEAYCNLTMALRELNQLDAAHSAAMRAVELRPEMGAGHNNLGIVLKDRGQIEAAMDAWRRAIGVEPGLAGAYNNLADALVGQGLVEEAVGWYERLRAIRPDANSESNRVFAMLLDPRQDSAAILTACRAWDGRYARALGRAAQGHERGRSGDRRLRIGYLSQQLCQSTVGWSLLPLLSQHDRKGFEVFCYSAGRRRDGMTDRLAGLADGWRDIASMTDEQTALRVREDGIDILVDLCGHTPGNRLLVFARKPAPVQVTFLGYCGTTGMEAMGYRLSDVHVDPPGSDLSCYSEETVVLPRTYWCYEPAGALPSVGALPALSAGHITFGCMNSFPKASGAARDLWGKVLLALPGSRMVIHSHEGSHRESVMRRFAEAGVSGDRIEFVARQAWVAYAETFDRIDIALDAMPYSGGITSCDTLMMGVPVVTLRGGTSVGRSGCSILSNVGLKELIAETAEGYVGIAGALGRDLRRLGELRSGLRERMERSALCDAKGYAQDVEAAYRKMWHSWDQAGEPSAVLP